MEAAFVNIIKVDTLDINESVQNLTFEMYIKLLRISACVIIISFKLPLFYQRKGLLFTNSS